MVFSLFIVFGSAAQASEASIGEPAPDFTLTDTYDETHTLSDYKGKIVILEWINHWCPFVGKHYKSGHMQKLQRLYTEKDVIWLSINSSAPGKQGHTLPDKANELSQEKEASPTAVLLDPDGEVGKLYGAKTTPHMFIINSDGILVYDGAIDDRPSTNIEDIETAKNYVQEAMEEVLADKEVSIPNTKPYGCTVKYK